MPFKDMLLHIDSYPEPTPAGTIDEAVRLAGMLGDRLSALALSIHFPVHGNRLTDYMLGLKDLARAEEAKSREACRKAFEQFRESCGEDLFGETHLEACELYLAADRVALRARTRDLCIVPIVDRFETGQEVAQAVIFGSGRPVVVFKSGVVKPNSRELGLVVVAWDGSRAAARALADALPALSAAREVRILTVLNEKPLPEHVAAMASQHLRAHGVYAKVDEVDGAGEAIGAVFRAYCEANAPDLFVMGAYGHSRLREVVLGGATDSMLAHADLPILLSH